MSLAELIKEGTYTNKEPYIMDGKNGGKKFMDRRSQIRYDFCNALESEFIPVESKMSPTQKRNTFNMAWRSYDDSTGSLNVVVYEYSILVALLEDKQ